MTGLDIFALVILLVLFIVVIAIWVILAMLPGKIAKNRNHPQAEAINIAGWLGALLGGLFWPIVLVWAFIKPRTNAAETPAPNSEELKSLKNRISSLEAVQEERSS